jgi:hypothetical protein
MTPRYWYGPKRFFGRRLAVTWEAWLFDGIWLVFWLSLTPLVRKDSQRPILGLGLMFAMLVIFVAFRSWKGEPRGWDD